MKLYTEDQVKELLEIQRGNCRAAVLNETMDIMVAEYALNAPLPFEDQFEQNYGIDVEQLLKEDIADKSLQENFDHFKRNKESAKIKYNECVPVLNSIISKIVNLKELIVSLSMEGLSTKEVVKEVVKLDSEFTKLSEEASKYRSEMDSQDVLIKNYIDWTERKMFMHWSYLRLLMATNEPWLEWKQKYDKYIM